MADRLKQIWSGFEGVTNRPLTGRGVGSIVVPSRQDYIVHDEEFLAQGFTAPADAAFAALRAQLSAAEKKAGRRLRDGETMNPYEAPDVSEASFDGDSDAARDLIRGLKATEARIRRSDLDYAQSLSAGKKKMFGKSSAAPAGFKSNRKKFLGLF